LGGGLRVQTVSAATTPATRWWCSMMGSAGFPQDAGRDDDNIGRLIQGHLRETGKYGLGWMIVAQSPTGIHDEVLRQSHTTYFGRGLRIGADQKHLEHNLGSDGHEAYKQI